MKRYQKGFTLVELITVIVASGVLIGGISLLVLAIIWLAKVVF